MDDNSSILECAANGIYVITTWADKHDFDPKTNLVSVVSDFFIALTGALEAIQKGNWDAYRESNYFTPQTLNNGGTKLGVWGDTVPEEVKTAVAAIEAKFKDGSLKVEWSTRETRRVKIRSKTLRKPMALAGAIGKGGYKSEKTQYRRGE